MSEEYVCAQDEREKELQQQGYIANGKAYWRIGRAIFIVEETGVNPPTPKETLDSPLGLCAALSGKAQEVLKPDMAKKLQMLFGSTGKLRIIIEGDPDSGIGGSNTIEATGYRFGLDDVWIDGKLVDTTHGDKAEILRNMAHQVRGFAGVLRFGNKKEDSYKVQKRCCESVAKRLEKLAAYLIDGKKEKYGYDKDTNTVTVPANLLESNESQKSGSEKP